ncbi:endonuclease/exonuclease/phosphatase family protein [Streptomyces sp. NPDC102441]|uniref:endonuclease/exonuclease/phosphatase family protein n=1 Tax=Streptomyces sp. NPDC102441 TaxID=3366176 RepID=UPI003822AF61
MTVCFTTYNLLDFTGRDDRTDHLRQAVAEAQPDVLAVQEIVADTAAGAARLLHQLADSLGLLCAVDTRGTEALASGQHRYHVGLLWRPGITPVREGWRAFEGGDFHHALARLQLDVGAREPVTFASYHADPFRPARRFDEAHRVVAALTRPPGHAAIGGDFNSISADRTAHGDYYDPDPYAHQEWYDDLLYQAEWNDDPDAPHHVDRRAAQALRRGGLLDAAAEFDAPWQPTTGHWPVADPFGSRRIDMIRTTRHLGPALAGYRVLRTPAALSASDHLPVSIDLEPALISSRPGKSTSRYRRHAPVQTHGATTNIVGPHAHITGPLIQTGNIGEIRLP